MKIEFYGTAAAEGVPGLFCKCDTCERTRKAGGKNIRTRSQALIDGVLLIDFPPDTYLHVLNYGLPLADIRHCLVTHSHSDHFYPSDFEMRKTGFAHGMAESLTLYGTDKVKESFEPFNQKFELRNEDRVIFSEIKPFELFFVEGYKITPLTADHAPAAGSVIYLIEKSGKALLYANDTGYFPDDTLRYLEKARVKLALVSFDCTAGDLKGWRSGHMGLDTIIELREKLFQIGCIDNKTKCYLHHFSHNSGTTHCEFEEIAKPYEFFVTYDNLEVDF